MRGVVLENITHKYAKLAARDGYLSPTLINNIRYELQALHFNTANLVVNGTTSRVSRGLDVDLTLEYPIGSMFIFINWFGSDTPSGNYKFRATEMSEYIP